MELRSQVRQMQTKIVDGHKLVREREEQLQVPPKSPTKSQKCPTGKPARPAKEPYEGKNSPTTGKSAYERALRTV
jgi:hypothetical protein